MKTNFFGLWDSNKVIDNIQLTQIKLWAKSILFFHDKSIIFLYTKKHIIPDNLINIDNLKLIYVDNFEELFLDTPLNGYKIPNNLSKPELSDIIRLVLLYKNGGTWLDIDDVVVREFPKEKNILGTFLWKNNKNKASYWGSTFNLVDGLLVSDKYKNFGFHIQNDPMINWEKGNEFLYKWMENIMKNKSADWGQKVPTEIIRKNPSILEQCDITLLPQHHLLLHPAFGNNKQFGNANRKGPMFPPYDLRITGKVNYDDMITKEEFWEVVKQTLEKHDYCCVKNSKNTGIIQCNEEKHKRWFIGHLCDLKNIENILDKIKKINADKKIKILIIGGHKTGSSTLKNTFNCEKTHSIDFENDKKRFNSDINILLFPFRDNNEIYKSAYFQDIIVNYYDYSPFNKQNGFLYNKYKNVCGDKCGLCYNCIHVKKKKEIINNTNVQDLYNHWCLFNYDKYHFLNSKYRINFLNNKYNIKINYLSNKYQVFYIEINKKIVKLIAFNISILNNNFNDLKYHIFTCSKPTLNFKNNNISKHKWYNIKYNEFIVLSKKIENISQSTASINLEGGLGNQMFKIFCLISYSIEHNKKYIFNRNLPIMNNKKIDTRYTYWNNIFKSISENTYDDKRDFKHQYNENKLYEYSEIPYYEKDVLLNGYYQNYRYFEKKYDEIINILNLNEIQKNIKSQYLKNENTISLHFRRGDYKKLDNYILLNICYYIEAIKYILEKDTSKCNEILCVYEIQDQEEVCKMIEELQDIFTEIKFIKVSPNLQDWEQMLLMSVCKHNIIANSTFSWWSAYINKNVDKIVCYPEKWFVKPKNIANMFPEKWKIIKNDNIY